MDSLYNHPFTKEVFFRKRPNLFTVEEGTLKVKEVFCKLPIHPGDTILSCMGYELRGKTYADYQKIFDNHANVIWITFLEARDIFEEFCLNPKRRLQHPTQHLISCECGYITLPRSKKELDKVVKIFQNKTCDHIKVSIKHVSFPHNRYLLLHFSGL